MSIYLGIDTSNYTTSCALYDSSEGRVKNLSKILPVKEGERGLRQSQAVFLHTKQLPLLLKELFSGCVQIDAIGCSNVPRLVKGSYMPCFLVGEGAAESIGAVYSKEVFKTSHQMGHILAALYSCQRLDLVRESSKFLAFHVSGGTTDMLLCNYDEQKVLNIEEIGHTLDLNAGQCIDRLGVKLNMTFPCGAQLEQLALKSRKSFKVKPAIKGFDCCLSGVESKCFTMLEAGEAPWDVCRFCLEYISCTLDEMAARALSFYGQMPVIFSGGVMADEIIKDELRRKYDAYFALPEFSKDNGAGIALYAAAVKGMI